MRQTPQVALPILLDRDADTSLPAQLAHRLRLLAADGTLRAGDSVPSTRALATHLGVSRGTVVTAYEQLLAEGWLVATPGGATEVNPKLSGQARPAPQPEGTPPRGLEAAPPVIDLRPGRPMTDGVAGPEWRSAWRAAANAPLDADIPPFGLPALRFAIADHLRRMRAVVCDPGRIAVTGGGREGLALLLLAAGIRSVGVEDPGFASLRRVLSRHGVAACSLPTDNLGLVTSALPQAGVPDAVIVTPSHQYPLGGSLPIDRRLALLAWAERHGVWVIEDDYDSELRYSSEPLPALTSLDAAGRVALLGTFSKTLTPALATGFVVFPTGLSDAAASVRRDLGQPVSLIAQRALASYLASGALARHTQRMRRIYRRRRDLVVRELIDIPGVRAYPMDGGLHAVVQFDADESAVIRDLAQRGVAVASLADYWASAPSTARRGLVFGFGGLSDADLTTGLAAIRDALDGASRSGVRRAD